MLLEVQKTKEEEEKLAKQEAYRKKIALMTENVNKMQKPQEESKNEQSDAPIVQDKTNETKDLAPQILEA